MIARSAPTATLLPSGKVLIAGGFHYEDNYPTRFFVTSAELYDPASGTWSATGSLETGRCGHTATLLPNGKVLLAGGQTDSSIPTTNSAELYDPATGTWTTTGNLVKPRVGHTATLLPNGKVLVAGGGTLYGPAMNSAELYDPATGTWTATGSLAGGRSGHTATLLPSGKVLVVGGVTTEPSYREIATAELYDPASGVWTATGSLTAERSGHTATLLPGGKVLVAGGGNGSSGWLSRVELFDPASGTWAPAGSLVNPRFEPTATLLPSGKVLFVSDGFSQFSPPINAELYDPVSASSTATGSPFTMRWEHTATLLSSGKVLVAGGTLGPVSLASAQLYGPKPGLLNIAARVHVQTGDNAMIGGFIIAGTQPKAVIVRAIGPSLSVPGALADPVIEIYDSSGVRTDTNDNWKDAPSRQEIIDSGLAPSNDLESALYSVINPGSYTVVVRGKNNAAGIGVFEVYDLDEAADSRLANVSTRGVVENGDSVLIGGLIVGGNNGAGTAKVLVRALGPSVPVAGALGDPTLELHNGSGTLIAFNDNWGVRPDGSDQSAEILATALIPTNELESALLETFPAGNYTAIVRGVNNATGVGLIEAYNLP
ncbi:MAG TPA: kelch repeat-containing protein [Chthoniobacterales bacterium]|nr:kelch repeat-containing protein [Chthoniobacterales bacterium]